jgi:hypothetical protein
VAGCRSPKKKAARTTKSGRLTMSQVREGETTLCMV